MTEPYLQAQGLEVARAAGLPTTVIDHTDFADRVAFDGALAEAIFVASSGAAAKADEERARTFMTAVVVMPGCSARRTASTSPMSPSMSGAPRVASRCPADRLSKITVR